MIKVYIRHLAFIMSDTSAPNDQTLFSIIKLVDITKSNKATIILFNPTYPPSDAPNKINL